MHLSKYIEETGGRTQRHRIEAGTVIIYRSHMWMEEHFFFQLLPIIFWVILKSYTFCSLFTPEPQKNTKLKINSGIMRIKR